MSARARTGGRVDGQTAQEYALNLEQNLCSLLDRLKSVIIEHHPYGVITLISRMVVSVGSAFLPSKTKSRNGRL